MGTCTYNDDNSITFKGNKDYTLDDAIDPQQNKKRVDYMEKPVVFNLFKVSGIYILREFRIASVLSRIWR